jgi:hypothetical protein
VSPYLVGLVAQIAAAQARVAAMHAENLCRTAAGNSPVYGEDAFNAQANALDHLAVAARNWQE